MTPSEPKTWTVRSGDLGDDWRPSAHLPQPPPAATVTVTRSAGSDGAIVVFIDTETEPDGSDGGPGLRVLVNNETVYTGVEHGGDDRDRPAGSVVVEVSPDQIAYTHEPEGSA
jgi:hypothetical protein